MAISTITSPRITSSDLRRPVQVMGAAFDGVIELV
jgi:hypothetical protein